MKRIRAISQADQDADEKKSARSIIDIDESLDEFGERPEINRRSAWKYFADDKDCREIKTMLQTPQEFAESGYYETRESCRDNIPRQLLDVCDFDNLLKFLKSDFTMSERGWTYFLTSIFTPTECKGITPNMNAEIVNGFLNALVPAIRIARHEQIFNTFFSILQKFTLGYFGRVSSYEFFAEMYAHLIDWYITNMTDRIQPPSGAGETSTTRDFYSQYAPYLLTHPTDAKDSKDAFEKNQSIITSLIYWGSFQKFVREVRKIQSDAESLEMFQIIAGIMKRALLNQYIPQNNIRNIRINLKFLNKIIADLKKKI